MYKILMSQRLCFYCYVRMVSWVSRCLAGASDLLGSIDFQNELSSAVLMFTLIFSLLFLLLQLIALKRKPKLLKPTGHTKQRTAGTHR